MSPNPKIVLAEESIVHLDVNDSGSWRRVATFSRESFDEGDLEACAEHLLALNANRHLKARIIEPGKTAPLVTWTSEHGWREWDSRRKS